MAKKPQFPQVTPEQVQLWEADPVTQAFLDCLKWFKEDVVESAGNGSHVDSSNSDLTHAMIHKNLGQQEGLSTAMDYHSLFDRFEMVLVVEEGDDNE